MRVDATIGTPTASPPRRPPGLRTDYCEDPIGNDQGASDGEVVRAVLAGEVERFAVLVHRCRDRFARYAVHLLGSADAAEDALQEAFIRAYDRLAQCRDPENFRQWFFLILRNSCYAEARLRKRHAGASLEEVLEPVAPDVSDRRLERGERRRTLEAALRRLTMEQREVFVLKHYEGLPYDEIARRTSASVASLKMRMHRAYDRLRAELAEDL